MAQTPKRPGGTKKKSPKKRLQNGLAAAAIVLLAAGCGVGGYFILRRPAPEPEMTLETIPVETLPTAAPTEAPEHYVLGAPIGFEPGLTGKAKTLLEYNADTVGWITIPNTLVDEPIVQSDDNAFYLDTGFDHKPYRAGTVFMDFRDTFGYDEASQSDNILLYGHNMANNTMFGSLRRYRQDLTYWKRAPFIELESNYQHYTYVIFGLVITDGSAEATWRYWDMEDFESQDEFDAYVETVRLKNMADIPLDVKYGDKLLTLSTCYSDADDSRFLVIARRVRPDETAESFAKVYADQ